MNRRDFVLGTGGMLVSPALCQFAAMASPLLQVQTYGAEVTGSYDKELPDMLVSYLGKRVNSLAEKWDQQRALIHTAADVEARNKVVRENVISMLHGFPARNSLDPVVVKVTKKDGYRIENVMFQSRPGFWVTGNIYVPEGNGPFPGIVSPCGHYPLARMLPQYQSVYVNFVKSGFVVLAYDPIGQGERREYWNPQTNVSDIEESVYEHSMCGQLLLLLGENLTEYLIWDGMRAIDYLMTRPEVDPKRVGCAGHSGGGTMTKMISAIDERIQCAAIIEGGTANRWPLKYAPWQPVGAPDIEQNLFPAALYGVDHVDLQYAIAPRPLLAAIEHYAPPFNHAAEEIRACYQKLGVPEKFTTVASDDPHSWTPKLKLASADWFSRWFYNRPGPKTEAAFEPEAPETLRCIPDGSIRYSKKGLNIYSVIAEKQAHLPPAAPAPESAAAAAAFKDEMRGMIRSLLRYKKVAQPLSVRRTASVPRNGYTIDKIQFLSEPDIYIPAWVYMPDNKTGVLPTILYVNDEGMDSEGMEFEGEEGSGLAYGLLDQLVRAGNLVVAVDVRGIGETRPPHPATGFSTGEFRQLFNVETALSYEAWSIDQSLLGMRVQDVVRSLDYLTSRNDVDTERLHVIGKGMGGLWGLYAAALDPRICSLISVQSLLSYRSLTEVDRYLYGADVFVLDVLSHFDLPQVAGAISGRPLAIVSPTDAMKRTVSKDYAQETYKWTQATYAAAGLQSLFIIESEGEGLATAQNYLTLLRTFEAAVKRTKVRENA